MIGLLTGYAAVGGGSFAAIKAGLSVAKGVRSFLQKRKDKLEAERVKKEQAEQARLMDSIGLMLKAKEEQKDG